MRVLIVDGDRTFADLLKTGLDRLGHKVDVAAPVEALTAVADAPPYDLAVVDVDDEAGRRFLETYRRVAPWMAAVVLTSAASLETSVAYLRGGETALALDYIQKPEPDMLKRIDGVLHRHFEKIERRGFTADLMAARAFYEDEPLAFTQHEFKVFLFFMEHPYERCTYADIARAIYGRVMTDEEAYTALRSTISRLRTRLREASGRSVLSRHTAGGIRFTPVGEGPRRDISYRQSTDGATAGKLTL